MIIAGIDPGITGALALTDGQGYLKIYPVPAAGGQPDYARWAQDWLPALRLAGHVWIEKVAAMPKQGVSSTFTFGSGVVITRSNRASSPSVLGASTAHTSYDGLAGRRSLLVTNPIKPPS